MRAVYAFLAVLPAALVATLPARAEWQASEVVKYYAITGSSGAALYASIGERGPTIRGSARAIAYTDFDLKWGRDYRADGTDCVLVAARPFLTITYLYPKPAGPLPPAVAARWQVFIDGVRAHERHHGELIRAMTGDIAAKTIGFRQQNDPGCKAIRKAVETPIREAFERYKTRTRAFEEAEMSQGGPVHQLILGLIQ